MIKYNDYEELMIIASCAVLLLAAGCKSKEEPVDPYVTPGTTENPN